MNICIIEDDSNLRANLRLLLGGEVGMNVVGAYGSAEAAMESMSWSDCEVLLVDIDLPGRSGVDLTRELHRKFPDLLILVHTISESRSNVFSAIKAGALGYLLKGSSPRVLIESLHILYAGGAPMSPRIARRVLSEMHEESAPASQSILSEREIEILSATSRGKTYKTVANTLGVSPHTVHAHVKRIYQKLQVADREGALMKARAMGVIW
ncbi:MAG: response regulator [Limisphaerales bacterium]